MRIKCPNCDAQYEVPEDVIPEAGRDVQCSNCGITWFQTKAPMVEDELPDDGDAGETPEPDADNTPEPAADDSPEPEADDSPEPETGSSPEPDADDTHSESPEPTAEQADNDAPVDTVEREDPGDDTEDSAEDDAETVEPPEGTGESEDPEPEASDNPEDAGDQRSLPRPPSTTVDPAVASILREEAEFEARMRSTEGGGLESQTELGLETVGREKDSSAITEAKVARLIGEDVAGSNSRGDMLPDIEEINSTFRGGEAAPAAAAAAVAAASTKRRKGGFLRGFLFIVVIAIALLAVYNYAPEIAEQVPQLEPTLTAYVGFVDQLRVSLDNAVSGFAPQ